MERSKRPTSYSKVSPGLTRASVRPMAISVSSEDLINITCLYPGSTLPAVVTPRLDSVSLAAWVRNNLDFIEKTLLKHGALLFRDFGLSSQADLEQIIEAANLQVMPYMESATPRTKLNSKVYTSTEFPSDQIIALHNELSYVLTFPMRIAFFCVRAADLGGETPIADVRKVLQRIPAKIKESFAERGWMLVRNFGDGFGPSWQDAYHIEDRAEVEDYFRNAGIEFEWRGNDRLRTRQVRPAITKHPKTGEAVWFNHVVFWHVSSLEQRVSELLLKEFEDDALPYNTFYGDGSSIEVSVIDEIREAYRQETVSIQWSEGDLLLMDNMLVAHGRAAYTGARRILVSMGDPFTRTDI